MAEIRQDPASGRWVIIATERSARPHDFQNRREPPKGGFCPFCEGNEDRTPPEVYAVRPAGSRPNGPGWKVRVVPNKYPALRLDASAAEDASELHHAVAGVGAHEVIIESPQHVITPPEMLTEDYAEVMRTYWVRTRALSEDPRLTYVLVFKNVGDVAGASLQHSHSQLIAVPVTPKRVLEEMARCAEHHAQSGSCLFCHLLEREEREQVRVIRQTGRFVAISPFAARFPFEMWVLPRQHVEHFHDTPQDAAVELAGLMQDVLARLDVALQEPPYNFAVHTSPLGDQAQGCYHWHIEVIPRVTRVAGFEWGSGFYINPMEPERAAEYLRQVPAEQVRARVGAARTTGVDLVGGQPSLP